jgi:putative membrane protein
MGMMKTLPTHAFHLRAVACVFAASCATALFGQAATHADTTTGAANSTETTASADHAEHMKLKHADRSFIEKADVAGREEVEISQIAAERASNPDVKKFAQMMVDDHTRANEELASIATACGVKLKDKPKNEDKWSRKDAKDFDRDYMKKMVDDHKKVIDLFSKESKDGADEQLVEFARKTLPKLQHHLDEAARLDNLVK